MQVERQFLKVSQRQVVIELPESFVNHHVELIALTVDEPALEMAHKRQPNPDIAGKGRTLGDLLAPVLADGD
jgi:hypothetical protein